MIDVKPTSSDTRAPQIVRESRSRPASSVPSGLWSVKAPPGGPLSVSSGFGERERSGASNASAMTSTSQPTASQKPKPSRRFGDDRDFFGAGHRKRRLVPVLVADEGRRVDVVLSGHGRPELSGRGTVYERVDDEVHDHVGERDDEHDALHDEVVLAEDGVDDRLADARDREDVLDDERAAEQRPGRQPEHGEEREARGSQRVAQEDAPLIAGLWTSRW